MRTPKSMLRCGCWLAAMRLPVRLYLELENYWKTSLAFRLFKA